MLQQVALAGGQGIFPVVDDARLLRGLLSDEALRLAIANPELNQLSVAADLMTPAVSVPQDMDLRTAAQLLVSNDLRGVPVVDDERRVIGILDEHDLASVMLI